MASALPQSHLLSDGVQSVYSLHSKMCWGASVTEISQHYSILAEISSSDFLTNSPTCQLLDHRAPIQLMVTRQKRAGQKRADKSAPTNAC